MDRWIIKKQAASIPVHAASTVEPSTSTNTKCKLTSILRKIQTHHTPALLTAHPSQSQTKSHSSYPKRHLDKMWEGLVQVIWSFRLLNIILELNTYSASSLCEWKVRSAIVLQYTFPDIQRIAPHSPCCWVLYSVLAVKKYKYEFETLIFSLFHRVMAPDPLTKMICCKFIYFDPALPLKCIPYSCGTVDCLQFHNIPYLGKATLASYGKCT